MESAIGKLLDLKNRFQGLLTNVTAMMGPGGADGVEQMIQKLEQLKGLIDQVHNQIKDPEKTTFVCVCIPEFLSIYETERLVQELSKSEIDTHNVVVNQVLFPTRTLRTSWNGMVRIRISCPRRQEISSARPSRGSACKIVTSLKSSNYTKIFT